LAVGSLAGRDEVRMCASRRKGILVEGSTLPFGEEEKGAEKTTEKKALKGRGARPGNF